MSKTISSFVMLIILLLKSNNIIIISNIIELNRADSGIKPLLADYIQSRKLNSRKFTKTFQVSTL